MSFEPREEHKEITEVMGILGLDGGNRPLWYPSYSSLLSLCLVALQFPIHIVMRVKRDRI